MSIDHGYPGGESMQITYPADEESPYASHPVASPWGDLAGTTQEWLRVAVSPGSTTEPGSDAARPAENTLILDAYGKYGSAIGEDCSVTITTGPHAGEYQVLGKPLHWRNALTGRGGCVMFQLEGVQG